MGLTGESLAGTKAGVAEMLSSLKRLARRMMAAMVTKGKAEMMKDIIADEEYENEPARG
jgi:hypothetical protein